MTQPMEQTNKLNSPVTTC